MEPSSSTPEDPALPPPLSYEEAQRLVAVAWASLRHGIAERAPLIPDLADVADRLEELTDPVGWAARALLD